MDISRFKRGIITISEFVNGIAEVRFLRGFEPSKEFCIVNEDGDFLVIYRNHTINIQGDSLLFVYPFEGDVARSMDITGKWGLISPSGKAISAFDYSYISPFKFGNAIVSRKIEFDPYNEGYRDGVINEEGVLSVAIKFRHVKRKNDVFISKEGIFDANGHFIINGVTVRSECDECTCFADGFFMLKKDGYLGLADENGRVLSDCIFCSIGTPKNGFVFCKTDNSAILISKTGKVITIAPNAENACYYHNGFVVVESLLSDSKTRVWTLLDESGRIILDHIPRLVTNVNYGFIVLIGNNSQESEVISFDGRVILGVGNYSVEFDSIPNSFIVTKNDLSQRYDNKGRKVAAYGESLVILDSKYQFCGDFYEGLTLVAKRGKRPRLLPLTNNKKKGRSFEDIMLQSIYKRHKDKFDSGLIMREQNAGHKDAVDLLSLPNEIQDSSDDLLWGYVDLYGKEVIPCQFAQALNFSCGLSRVSYRVGKWFYGYINTIGDFVIPRKYSYASVFNEGYAVVKYDTSYSWFIINSQGIEICNISGYLHVNTVHDGLLLAQNTVGNWGFINIAGNTVIPFVFKRATDFINGESSVVFASHYSDDRQYTIKKNGYLLQESGGVGHILKVDINCFTSIGSFINDKAIIDYGKKQGVISSNGEILIEPRDCFKFYFDKDGRLIAKLDTMDLYVSEDGKNLSDKDECQLLLSNDYREYTHIIDSLFAVKNERGVGVIGKDGIIIPCEYEKVYLHEDKKHLIATCQRKGGEWNIIVENYHVFNLDGSVSQDLLGWEREIDILASSLDSAIYEEEYDVLDAPDEIKYGIGYGNHRYGGSYAQDEMDYSDDCIDDAFDGEPDAYWNID